MKRLAVLACVLVATAACNTTQTSGVPAPRRPPPVLVGPDPPAPQMPATYIRTPNGTMVCRQVFDIIQCN